MKRLPARLVAAATLGSPPLAAAQIGFGSHTFHFQLNTTVPLENAVMIVVEEDPSDYSFSLRHLMTSGTLWRNISVGSHSFVVLLNEPKPYRTFYTFLANTASGLVVHMDAIPANWVTRPGSGRNWSDLFGQWSKSSVEDALRALYQGEPGAVDSFVSFGTRWGVRWSLLESPATQVSFSEPTITGSSSMGLVDSVPVPEPATVALDALGLAAAAVRRRSRS
ncbi:MAG: PEP-CTERM sorting domain-containing protein [Fimbriimonadales bacterium]|nr:PEP-CTERM sorting domain-containing protein [Fimbriimonadales bacterium]